MTETEELAFKLGEEVARSQEWMHKAELAQKRADNAEASATALIEVAAAANYQLVSLNNPFHAPMARAKLQAALMALWEHLGVDENTPFSADPYASARAIITERLAAKGRR